MRVTVRDRNAEGPWGSGPTNPTLVTIDIPNTCPRCGGPRGNPRHVRQHDDGVTYWVDVWDNPCGHLDRYTDVVKEGTVRP